MKAKSRKRLLISSVAMLLVAMLALGTATFAWFTQNKKVTADGMNVTATAAKGLVISGDNGEHWASSYSFVNAAYDLNACSIPYTNNTPTPAYKPISEYYTVTNNKISGKWTSDNSASFVGTEEGNKAVFTKNESFPTVPTTGQAAVAYPDTGAKYLAAYEVGIKSTGAEITGITGTLTITDVNSKNASKFIRVAVFEQDTTATQSLTATPTKVIGDESGADAITAITPAVESQKLEASYSVSNLSVNTTPKWYTILVWFEGQDVDCVDTNSANAANITWTFQYE